MRKYIMIMLLIATGATQGYAQLKVSCESLKGGSKSSGINREIASACKRIWETNAGLGVAGPFGTYKRHVFTGSTAIIRNELGVILQKKYYLRAVIQNKRGVCKVADVTLAKPYEGGGRYGGFSGAYVQGYAPKVNCDCVDQLPDWLNTGSALTQDDIKMNKAIPIGNKGWKKYEAGEYEKCIELSDKANAIYPVGLFFANKGLSQLMLGRNEEAKASYKSAIEHMRKQSKTKARSDFKAVIADIDNAKEKKSSIKSEEIRALLKKEYDNL